MPDRTALFVRVPAEDAERLDRAAFALKASKQDLVAGLLARYVDPGSPEGLASLRGLTGEMALFRRGRRSTDLVALTDVDLLVLKNERLEWLIRNRPEVTIEILKRLSEYVARSNLHPSAPPPQS